jgi:hypothetical protein
LTPWWTKRGVQISGLILFAVVAVYSLIYIDVVSRAKESYMEAEKYMDWNSHPEKKKAFFEDQFQQQKKKLDEDHWKKKLSDEEYRKKLESIEFDKNFSLEESSLKYAYQWYKDTYELFSPPESQWVKQAREKAPQALALWKEELTQKKIPFADYMFE